MRESKSLSTIKAEAIKLLQFKIDTAVDKSESSYAQNAKLVNPWHKRNYDVKEAEINDSESQDIEDFESEHPFSDNSEDVSGVHLINNDNSEFGDNEVSNVIEDFIIKLSKFLIQKRKTLLDIIHNCVYDMVFNSLEVQLIDSYYLFLWLENSGFKISNEHRVPIVKGLKHKHSLNGIDVMNLQLALEEIGAPEIWSDQRYKELRGYEVRLFNRIIQELDNKSVSIKELFGPKNFKSITISSPSCAAADFDIISLDKFIEILEDNKYFDDEEISDGIEDSSNRNLA